MARRRRRSGTLLGLALNRISGAWDDDLLARLLADLRGKTDLDLSLSGFAEDDVDRLLKRLGSRERREQPERFDLESALDDATKAPRTAPSDMWQLGPHRVACGDATDQASVDRLLARVRPAMAFKDPPYNVSLGDHGGQQRESRRRRIQNDALDPTAWEASGSSGS